MADPILDGLDVLASLQLKANVDTAFKSQAAARAGAKRVPYRTFFRNAESYLDVPVVFTGEIIQALYDEPWTGDDCTGLWDVLDGTATILRVNVTKDQYGLYEDTVYVVYLGDQRLIEDDVIEFVGVSGGLKTYDTTSGGSVTIPEVITNKFVIIRN